MEFPKANPNRKELDPRFNKVSPDPEGDERFTPQDVADMVDSSGVIASNLDVEETVERLEVMFGSGEESEEE